MCMPQLFACDTGHRTSGAKEWEGFFLTPRHLLREASEKVMTHNPSFFFLTRKSIFFYQGIQVLGSHSWVRHKFGVLSSDSGTGLAPLGLSSINRSISMATRISASDVLSPI
jgi:hypothetical protein